MASANARCRDRRTGEGSNVRPRIDDPSSCRHRCRCRCRCLLPLSSAVSLCRPRAATSLQRAPQPFWNPPPCSAASPHCRAWKDDRPDPQRAFFLPLSGERQTAVSCAALPEQQQHGSGRVRDQEHCRSSSTSRISIARAAAVVRTQLDRRATVPLPPPPVVLSNRYIL